MKSKSVLLFIVFTVCLLFSFTLAAQNKDSAVDGGVQRWEHLALSVDAARGVGDAEAGQKIVKLGNEGWELVAVESLAKDGTTTQLVYCFKRPK